MATEKKYLDLQGLQHLKEQGILVKHDINKKVDAAAVKVGKDITGHVVIGGALTPSDIDAVPNTRTIAGIDLKDNITKDELRSQLGITGAMHFAGTTTTVLTDGATTNPIKVNSKDYTAIAGDVVLYSGKEFIWTGSAWEILGDEGSYALKTRTINGDGTYITGGGDLSANRTLSHKTYTAADAAPVKIGRDSGGHVVIGGALSTASDGAHTHTVSSTIPASSFLTSASGSTTKISLKPNTDTFVKSYPGVKSNLVTTTVTGVSGSTSASAVSGGSTKDIAKAGTAVVYGKANVGTAVTVATRASSQTTVGNANVGAELSILGIDSSTTATASKATAGTAKDVAKAGTAVTVAKRDTTAKTIGNANVGAEVQATEYNSSTPAYTAKYVESEECLTLTALGSITFNKVTASTSTIYGCSSSDASVTPAVSNGTITPYTFSNVTVPVAASAATVFNPATSSTTKIYGVGGTESITPAVAAPSTQIIVPAVSNGQLTGSYTIGSVDVPVAASTATTVATGALATDGSGASVMTGLGTATTNTAITSATIQSGTAGDVTVVSSVSSSKNSAAVTISGSAASNGAHTHEIQ